MYLNGVGVNFVFCPIPVTLHGIDGNFSKIQLNGGGGVVISSVARARLAVGGIGAGGWCTRGIGV